MDCTTLAATGGGLPLPILIIGAALVAAGGLLFALRRNPGRGVRVAGVLVLGVLLAGGFAVSAPGQAHAADSTCTESTPATPVTPAPTHPAVEPAVPTPDPAPAPDPTPTPDPAEHAVTAGDTTTMMSFQTVTVPGDPEFSYTTPALEEWRDGGHYLGQVADLTAFVTTESPAHTIDWAWFDLDPRTPAVDHTLDFGASGRATFDPATHAVTYYGLMVVGAGGSRADMFIPATPLTYTVRDTGGTLSNTGEIRIAPYGYDLVAP